MARQKNDELPFDKREYSQRMEAVEKLESDLLTPGQQKKVRFLLKFMFKHKESSCEGDMTFVRENDRPEKPVRGFSLADEMEVSKRTLENWLAWAIKIGVLMTSVDCDAWGVRRTTSSIVWPKVKMGGDQRATVSDQRATVARSLDQYSNSDQSPNTPKGVREGSDFLDLKNQLTRLDVRGTSCVDVAIAGKATEADVQAAIDSAMQQKTRPAPNVIYGRIKAMATNPQLATAPWVDAIAKTNELRQQDADHYERRRSRSNRIRQLGETESSAAIADAIASTDPNWSWREERKCLKKSSS